MRVLQLWPGSDAIPDNVQAWMDRWRELADGRYTLVRGDEFVARFPFAVSVADSIWGRPDWSRPRVYGDGTSEWCRFVTDMARYDAMASSESSAGTLYIDIDHEPVVHTLEAIVPDQSRAWLCQSMSSGMIARRHIPDHVSNCAMYCPPGGRIAKAMGGICKQIVCWLEAPPARVCHLTGPTLLSSVWRAVEPDARIWPFGAICTPEQRNENTLVVRHQRWREGL